MTDDLQYICSKIEKKGAVLIPLDKLVGKFGLRVGYVIKITKADNDQAHGHTNKLFGRPMREKTPSLKHYLPVIPSSFSTPNPIRFPTAVLDEKKLWGLELFVLDRSLFNQFSNDKYAPGRTFSIYKPKH